jgi:hypothetical protein
MNSHPVWPEQWAVQASVAANRVENRLSIALPTAATPAQQAVRDAVCRHVEEARGACRCSGRRTTRGIRDRWRGTSVEQAYLNLHAAKVFLVEVLPDAELDAVVPDVATRLGMALDRNDPRRVEAERLLATAEGPARRAVIKQAMETGYDASDEEYVRLRDFRNIVIKAAVAISLLTALFVGLIALSPDTVPLCFDPGVTVSAPGAPTTPAVCPSGQRANSTYGDVLVVAGLGAVGGALGALIAIRNLRGTSTPYSVTTALAVLKVPAGALTAVIGMLLLSGGFIPGLTNLDNQAQILAYALVFGVAQQIVTRVADGRAQQILDNLPSKDPQSKPAQPPAMAPHAPAAAPDQAAPAAETAETAPAAETAETAPAAETAAPAPAAETAAPAPAAVEAAPAPVDGAAVDGVQARDAFLTPAEVVDLTHETFPLDPEAADRMPPDEGRPDVTEHEAAQTGTDARG